MATFLTSTNRVNWSKGRSPRSPTLVSSSDSKTALEGLLHISELAEHKVEDPEEVVKVGDEIEVKVLRVDTDERKIGLSLKRVDWGEEQEKAAAADEAAENQVPPAEGDLKGGLGGGEGPLFPTGD